MYIELDVVMHVCNFSTWKAEARASSSRLSWAMQLLLIWEVIIMMIDNLLKNERHKLSTFSSEQLQAEVRTGALWCGHSFLFFFGSIHQLQRSAWPGIWNFRHGIIYPGHEGAIDDHLGDTSIDNQFILFIMVKGRTAVCKSYSKSCCNLPTGGGVITLKHLFRLRVLLWFRSPSSPIMVPLDIIPRSHQCRKNPP